MAARSSADVGVVAFISLTRALQRDGLFEFLICQFLQRQRGAETGEERNEKVGERRTSEERTSNVGERETDSYHKKLSLSPDAN